MPSERSGPVAGVVLAAGASTRMGRNKLLFQLEGQSMLRRVAESALAAGLDPVIVVLGHEAERARLELDGLPCLSVLNPDYARGQNTSLCAGITAVPDGAAAAVVVLADMPFVTPAMIAAVMERYRDGPAPLVFSSYGGVQAPPTLYGRDLFPELRMLEGEGGGKQVVKRHASEAAMVSWPAEALTDLDVPEDFERVKARLGAA